MGKVKVLAGVLFIFAVSGHAEPLSSALPGTTAWEWRQAASFGGPPTWFSAAFTIGDVAYVGTGYGANNEFWRYEAGREAWTRRSPFPGIVRGAAIAFSVGDRGYLGMGYSEGGRLADLWEYDPSADRWAQKASLPGAVRDHCAVLALGGKAYVVGGMTGRGNSSSDLKEVWEYDPGSDRWARKADMPETLVWAAYFVLEGKGYIAVGGQQPDPVARKLWEYDPRADRWTRKADFPGSLRFRAVGFSLNGAGYLCAGTEYIAPGAAKVASDLWEYSPASDTWTRLPDFPGPARGAAVGFTLGPRVYIGLGADAKLTLLGDFWQATPPAGGTGR